MFKLTVPKRHFNEGYQRKFQFLQFFTFIDDLSHFIHFRYKPFPHFAATRRRMLIYQIKSFTSFTLVLPKIKSYVFFSNKFEGVTMPGFFVSHSFVEKLLLCANGWPRIKLQLRFITHKSETKCTFHFKKNF